MRIQNSYSRVKYLTINTIILTKRKGTIGLPGVILYCGTKTEPMSIFTYTDQLLLQKYHSLKFLLP